MLVWHVLMHNVKRSAPDKALLQHLHLSPLAKQTLLAFTFSTRKVKTCCANGCEGVFVH